MITSAEDRLTRWGEWLMAGRGQTGRGVSVMWEMATCNGFKGPVVPIKDLEASRAHDWFMQLPKPSQMLLIEVYCTGRTSREHAAHLRVSLRTLYTRLHKLHGEFLEAMAGVSPSKTKPVNSGQLGSGVRGR